MQHVWNLHIPPISLVCMISPKSLNQDVNIILLKLLPNVSSFFRLILVYQPWSVSKSFLSIQKYFNYPIHSSWQTISWLWNSLWGFKNKRLFLGRLIVCPDCISLKAGINSTNRIICQFLYGCIVLKGYDKQRNNNTHIIVTLFRGTILANYLMRI